jgi:hypothetical protein
MGRHGAGQGSPRANRPADHERRGGILRYNTTVVVLCGTTYSVFESYPYMIRKNENQLIDFYGLLKTVYPGNIG